VDRAAGCRNPPALISVIVPAHNAAATLDAQLRCLAAQDYAASWEVVVSDSGSTDETAAIARRWTDRLPALRVVDASSRPGACAARNIGAAAARGDFLAFCDADDEADEGWLTGLAAAALDADMVGGVSDEETLNAANREVYQPPTWDQLEVWGEFKPFCQGGNCGIWTNVFESVGGWNEDYRRATDVELSWRVAFSGHRLRLAPAALTRYRHRSDDRELIRQFYGWGLADAQLYRSFRDRGMRRSPSRDAAAAWLGLVCHLPALLRPGALRTRWVAHAARRWGRVRGSIRWRVVYL